MPTAMPLDPLTSRFRGSLARQNGGLHQPSRRSSPCESTVSNLMSSSSATAAAVMRASVYRIAAGGSPSMDPKLPCLSISRQRVFQFWPMIDQGGIDHRLAVRVVVARGVAGDLRALAVLSSRREIEIVHRHENAALRGLETVADVRQRPVHDGAHRVGQVGIVEFAFDLQVDHVSNGGGGWRDDVRVGIGRETVRPGFVLRIFVRIFVRFFVRIRGDRVFTHAGLRVPL